MRSVIVFILVVTTVIAAKRKEESCITPNGETATCMPIKDCPVLLNVIAITNSSVIEFLRQSQCGYEKKQLLVCCGSSASLIASTISTSKRSRTADKFGCGYDNPRIFPGTVSYIDEYPWLAALEYQETETKQNVGFMCGGSLISNRFVLTAGHCLRYDKHEVTRVWLGEYQLSTDPDCEEIVETFCIGPVTKIGIEEKIIHPQYSPLTRENDIGLLRLEKNIEYTDYIQPVCLPTVKFPDVELYGRFGVAGWGISENGPLADIKRKTYVALLEHEACKGTHNFEPASNQLCFTDKGINGSCWGGSGGAILRWHRFEGRWVDGPWYQEGVISWSTGCDHAIYTPLSTYVDWIINTIKE